MRSMIFLVVLIISLAYLLGPAIIASPRFTLSLSVAAFFMFLALTNFEIGLMMLLVFIPFSAQANIGEFAGGAPLDIGTDDFFTACLFVIWLVYLAKNKTAPFVKSPLTFPFLGYFAASIISFLPLILLRVGNPTLSFLHLFKWYEYVFIYFVVVKTLQTRPQIIKFTVLAVGSSVLVALMQVVQIAAGSRQGLISEDTKFGSWATAAFESNGILGAFYVMFLSIIVSFLVTYGRSAKSRIFLIGLAALMSFTLFYTFNRAAYLAIILALAILGGLYRRRLLFLTILLFICMPVFMSRVVSQEIKQTITVQEDQFRETRNPYFLKFYRSKGRATTFQLDPSSRERLHVWRKVRKLIYHHPVLGTGYWSGRYYLRHFTAHNQYLTIILETGVLGILTFLWIFRNLLTNALAFSKETQDPFYRALARGLVAGVSGLLLHCFFGETFESFRLTGPLWILAAARRIETESRQTAEYAGYPAS
jgi:O-antigen ligase